MGPTDTGQAALSCLAAFPRVPLPFPGRAPWKLKRCLSCMLEHSALWWEIPATPTRGGRCARGLRRAFFLLTAS